MINIKDKPVKDSLISFMNNYKIKNHLLYEKIKYYKVNV
jgi:hypothetical protein